MKNYQDVNLLDLGKSLEAYRQRARALIEKPTEHNAVETNIASMTLYDSIYLLKERDRQAFEDYVGLFLQELSEPLKAIEHQERHYKRLLDAEKRKYAETPQEKKDPVMRERIRELEIILRNFTSSLVQMRLRGKLLAKTKNKNRTDHH